jgi:hypothetical protein
LTTMAKVAGGRRKGQAYHLQMSGSNATLSFKYIIESPSDSDKG